MSTKFVPKHKGDKNPNPKLLKLVRHITDRIPGKIKMDTDAPEYWGLACIFEDEMDAVTREAALDLMLDMLRATDYCNIGSYWLRENSRAPDASQTLIEGFEGRVAFGCLSIDNRSLSKSAAAFLERLREKIKISRTALTSCQ